MGAFEPAVSVLIRVRNEGPHLRRVICALASQKPAATELIVVDNESSDDSRRVAVESGAVVLDIARSEFSYGRALNRGIQAARGEIIVVLSAHALPLGSDFIAKAVAPFKDSRVAAVRCLHVGNHRELETWMQPKVLGWPAEVDAVIAQGPVACACALRRSAWELEPFDEQMIAVEDKFWAYEVLKRGFLVASSEAMYLYMRDLGLLEGVRKLNRDRLEYYRKTGRHFQSPPISLKRLVSKIFFGIPKRALRTALQDSLLYLHLKSIPLQARRKASSGSIR